MIGSNKCVVHFFPNGLTFWIKIRDRRRGFSSSVGDFLVMSATKNACWVSLYKAYHNSLLLFSLQHICTHTHTQIILRFVIFEKNCLIISHSVWQFVFCENFVLLGGTYHQEWTNIVYHRIRSEFGNNITMYQVWIESDTFFESYRVNYPPRQTAGGTPLDWLQIS